MKNNTYKIEQLYVIHESTDLCEGRSPHHTLGYATTLEIAKNFALGKGVMGTSACVEATKKDVLIAFNSDNNKWEVPINAVCGGITWLPIIDTMITPKYTQQQINAMIYMCVLCDNISISENDAIRRLNKLTKENIAKLEAAYTR